MITAKLQNAIASDRTSITARLLNAVSLFLMVASALLALTLLRGAKAGAAQASA